MSFLPKKLAPNRAFSVVARQIDVSLGARAHATSTPAFARRERDRTINTLCLGKFATVIIDRCFAKRSDLIAFDAAYIDGAVRAASTL